MSTVVGSWKKLSIRQRRLFAAFGIAMLWLLATVPMASATTPVLVPMQAPAGMGWLNLSDSRGISIWQYQLSVDEGGVTHPIVAMFAGIAQLSWELYRFLVAVALWFLHWVMGGTWLDLIVTPANAISDGISRAIARLGIGPFALMLGTVCACLIILKGQIARGISQVMIVALISALSMGALAKPLDLVAGEDGWIRTALAGGEAIGSVIEEAPGKPTTPDQIRDAHSKRLVDVFLRQPTQAINFGEVLDGAQKDCSGSWDEAIKKGGDDSEDIRKAVGKCDKKYSNYADKTTGGTAMGALFMIPGACVLLILITVVAGSTLLAAFMAIVEAVAMIVHLVIGLVPGSARTGLIRSFTNMLLASVGLSVASIFMSALLVVVESVLGSKRAPMESFFIVDAVLLVGLIVFRIKREALHRKAEQISRSLAHHLGGGKGDHQSGGSLGDKLSNGAKQLTARGAHSASSMARGAARAVSPAAHYKRKAVRSGAKMLTRKAQGAKIQKDILKNEKKLSGERIADYQDSREDRATLRQQVIEKNRLAMAESKRAVKPKRSPSAPPRSKAPAGAGKHRPRSKDSAAQPRKQQPRDKATTAQGGKQTLQKLTKVVPKAAMAAKVARRLKGL